jgi:hypothetical protein
MSHFGDQELVRARTGLLDALQALEPQLDSLILVGAQAVYLHTHNLLLPVVASTSDADLVFDPDLLLSDPTVDQAMAKAGFVPNPMQDAVGSWLSSNGVPIDLMVPFSAGGFGRRGARIPPHGARAIRKTVGFECSVFDNTKHEIHSLDWVDKRSFTLSVASPAALLVSKLIKFWERVESPRFFAKDAYDIYRLLVFSDVNEIAVAITGYLERTGLQAEASLAVGCLEVHFAQSQNSAGPEAAAWAERLIGEPEKVRARTWALSSQLLAVIGG